MIKITKSDVIWSYAGSILNLGTSVFVLPFVLRFLHTEELGLWYVFGSIAALVGLLDFGFSPSIMRNIIYAWSGATRLHKEGVPDIVGNAVEPNYNLMADLIYASKRIYLIIASLAGLALALLGTPYIHSLVQSQPDGFLIAWLIYSIGIVLNLYYSYWNPLLRGVGAMREASQVQVVTRISHIVLTVPGLYLGGGLIWLATMYVVSGLLLRVLSKMMFNRISKIKDYQTGSGTLSHVQVLSTIWPNAKKQGLVTVGAWLITRSTTLLSSHFYGLEVTAQLGLSLQLYGFIGGLSSLLFHTYAPEITSLRLDGTTAAFKKLFSRSMFAQWLMSCVGCLAVVFLAPVALRSLGSNASLLPLPILVVLGIVLILEWNHSTFAAFITLTNRVPFLASSLVSGIGIVALSLFMANVTSLGVLGLVLSQGIVQLMYNNWYWPRMVCMENDLSIPQMAWDGLRDVLKLGRRLLIGRTVVK